MKKHLQIYKIEQHTPEWYEFRKRGIGGSEIGTVLNINKYDTAARLYHEKIGTIPPKTDDNAAMFWGRYMEEHIANIWRFYDGEGDNYIENFKAGKLVRDCRNVNGYVINPKYPWLFASIDRLINIKGGVNLITGEALKTEAILEIKNMSFWISKVWEDGIPIQYLAQVHQYMIVMETDYCEIAMLVDGNRLVVEKIQRDEELVKRILSISQRWWNDRVIPAKEALKMRDEAEMAGNINEYEKCDTIIQHLEPDPDRSEAYKDFMSESFVKERDVVDGTIELYDIAKTYEILNAIKNKINGEQNLIKNIFIKYMKDHGSDSVSFDRLGKVNWSETKGRSSRTFGCKIKEKPGKDIIDNEFSKLNLNCY